jgi:hypothetical protein
LEKTSEKLFEYNPVIISIHPKLPVISTSFFDLAKVIPTNRPVCIRNYLKRISCLQPIMSDPGPGQGGEVASPVQVYYLPYTLACHASSP